MARFLIAFVVVASAFVVADDSQAANRTLSRAEIRSMPMVARPNRPGHFFGNTVRRFSRRR